ELLTRRMRRRLGGAAFRAAGYARRPSEMTGRHDRTPYETAEADGRSPGDVAELAAFLVLEDQLPAAVRHLLLFDHRLAVVCPHAARDPRHSPPAPVVETHGLPRAARRRPVAGVDDRVDDVAVVERLHRLAALVHRLEHVGEHVDVAELADLVTHREKPTAHRLRLLRDIVTTGARREHL